MSVVIDDILSTAQSNWTKEEGPYHHIVISSRIRLARNISKIPMPIFQNETEGQHVLDKVKKVAESKELRDDNALEFYRLKDINALDRRILLEKHLISPDHCQEDVRRGLLVNKDESISIMVNEEDHLRIQVLYPGLQLNKAWEKVDNIDDILENHLEYAYDAEKGFLTACPTNVGTGMRASVMIHLPALTMTKQAPRIFSALGQLGLAVRGLYGEGTEAIGNIYQISNQITLGQKETEIIQSLTAVTRQIIEKEEEIRGALVKEKKLQLQDRVGRAYGILQNAAIMDSKEALNLLSDFRLGLDLELIHTDLKGQQLTELMVMIQPGFLQKYKKKPMQSLDRDAARAELIKEKLKGGHNDVY